MDTTTPFPRRTHVLNLLFRSAAVTFILLAILSFTPSVVKAEKTLPDLQTDPLLAAMRTELQRAKESLRLPDQPAPYFIEYWVQESVSANLSGKYGGITHTHPDLHPRRAAGVQVRVGSYEFDNMNLPLALRFNATDYADFMEENDWQLAEVPLEGEGAALRSALWVLGDTAYKRAVGEYQKKKMLQSTGVKKEPLDDFSREKSVVFVEPIMEVGVSVDDEVWKDAVRKVTGYLARQEGIMEPTMDIQAARDVNYYMNTEGTVLRTSELLYTIDISAWTRTPDGIKVANFRHFQVQDPKELPDGKKLLAEAEALARELAELRNAEEFNPYSGPAILGPDVAGVFFHEALGHRLEGERQRMTESGQTFRDKVGDRIISEQISIVDDPTLPCFKGKSLSGHYRYDSEGVAAQKVTLVNRGKLANYLLSRTPIKGFAGSNGHARSQNPQANLLYGHPVGRMATLMVESENRHSLDTLKKMLIEEAKKQGKPYGLIIRHIRNGETDTKGPSASGLGGNFQAFKATPVLVYAVDVATGKERLVRGVELVGTPLVSLEKVIAAGNDDDVFNASCGAESGWVPVSVVSPSILTAQVELQRVGGNPKRSPLLFSPFQEKR